MSTIQTYTYTKSDLEENADVVKVSVLKALINEGLIDINIAEKWSKTHTVIIKVKPFFRTITNLWNKQKESSGFYYTVVVDVDNELDSKIKLVKP